jgi:flagellar M-ring protein FliF
MEQQYGNRLAAQAQTLLDRVLGPGHAVVSVQAALDLSQKNSTAETYQYKKGTPPYSQSSSTETYSGTGNAVGGVLGNTSNGTAGGSGGNSTYNKKSSTSDNSVDKITTNMVTPPGNIQRLTVSVVMDGTVSGNINQAQIQSLVGNAVGLNPTRGDAITVAAMPFSNAAAQQAAAELAAAKKAEQQAQMWSLIKTGAIGLGIVLLVLIVWLRSRRRQPVEEEYEPLELSDDMLAELDRLRIQSTREVVDPIDREALELEAAERQRVRGEISQMVSERPDEVAAMLRGWLSESRSGAGS